MNLYNDEVRKAIKLAKFPHGFRYDIIEYPLADIPHLSLVIYKDNFSMFPDDKIEEIAFKLNALLTEIKKMGVPIILEDRGAEYA